MKTEQVITTWSVTASKTSESGGQQGRKGKVFCFLGLLIGLVFFFFFAYDISLEGHPQLFDAGETVLYQDTCVCYNKPLIKTLNIISIIKKQIYDCFSATALKETFEIPLGGDALAMTHNKLLQKSFKFICHDMLSDQLSCQSRKHSPTENFSFCP